ncbi:hypothetical protein Taro_049373 [Colocasia esculenta]|uniref:FAD-binding PCMH-type domain-containing protein n=1 Tax=Colocasia esculenta TaxID=4460 RepID=A0A843XAR0_COLES|nr:hypothetical protein [Colocasia esculenta]
MFTPLKHSMPSPELAKHHNMAPSPEASTIKFSIFSFLLLLLLHHTSSSLAAAMNSTATDPQEAFVKCFLDHHPGAPSNIIHVKNSSSLDTVYRSNIQNIRFLVSSSNTKPLIVVTPTAESHVRTSVTCGRAAGLGVRARSGGHDYEGMSYVSDGPQFVIVDLVNLRSVAVDVKGGTAWVGAGATVGEVYYNVGKSSPTAGFPASICTTVGIGGLITGGGIGTIMRKYGVAADNVVDARVVDAQGRLLDRKSMGEDLFWALRGGGGASFGIVVAFKLSLVSVPPKVTVFTVKRTLNQNVTALLHRWQYVADKFDDNLFIRTLAHAVDDKASPGGRNIQVLFNSLYLGTREQLLPLMQRSFPELGLQASDCTEMTWLESVLYFAGHTGLAPEVLLDRRPGFNSSFKAKSDFVKEPISVAGWESIWAFLMAAKGQPLLMIMDPLGGILARIPETSIAFPHRKGNLFNIQYFMRWFETDAAVTQGHLDWMRMMYGFMAPYVSKYPRAAYLNYKDIDLGRSSEGPGAFAAASSSWGSQYYLGNFKRLASVKGRVDGDNFFKNEQSIPPLV